MTGNLDEVIIENIAKYSQAYDAIVKRKDAIIKKHTGAKRLVARVEY
jgi:uncharacterized protein